MPQDNRWLRDNADLLYLGLMFPSCIAVGTAIGYYVDKWFHTDPFGKLIGFVLGVIAGFWNFYQDYERLFGAKKKDKTKEKDDESGKN